MAQSSLEYWRQREAAQRDKNITEEAEYEKHIQKIYADTLDRVNKEINGFFVKYATKEGITIAEAKRRVSKLDIKEYSEKAKRYVEEKNFSEKANEEMRLYNLTMKVNRLELLKANIGLELIDGFSQLENYEGKILNDRTLAEMERQAGILGETVLEPAKKAHAIVNASFHNAQFSDRIWMYQDMLKSELSILLTRGLIQGLNPRQLAVDIKKRFGVSLSNATRLMRTEMARVQIGAQKQSYERNGYEEYEFIALTGHACEDCQALDGKHFKVIKMQPGLNAPPMHPACRCSTSAYMDREVFDKWLEAESGVESERNTVDYMGSANAREKTKTPFGELTLKQFKKYEHDIWTEDNSRETRRTAKLIDSLARSAKELMPKGMSVPKIVIVDKKKLGKGRYGGYDYKTDTIYYPNAYESTDSIRKILESGYFGGISPETVVLHEIGHKDHWDQARRLYKDNPKRYNSLEDAKHYLDYSRREALVRKLYSDPDFLVRNISENADVGLSLNRTINEFQADYFVRQCQNTVTDELKDFLEGINHDALTR